jgi:hypothetical protein
LHIFITFGSIKDNGWFTATLHMLPVGHNFPNQETQLISYDSNKRKNEISANK